MTRLRALKAKDVIRILEKNGFELIRQDGSHRFFRRPNSPGLVCVPVHGGRDIPQNTMRRIVKKSNLQIDFFL